MFKTSKSKIDKAGLVLSNVNSQIDEEYLELEEMFDEYRASHLDPLSRTTLELQGWLHEYGGHYYIAQRLKRKPQILRKLRRFSVRLTQLQDIGGLRIIVDNNSDVDNLLDFIKRQGSGHSGFKILRETDYRERGRDDSGYRALHLILNRERLTLELQLRSRIQHHWAESIERTSVIYGYHLKEQEGSPTVIGYFKLLSDIFFEMESGREISQPSKLSLDQLRQSAEQVISSSARGRVLGSYVNDDIVKTLSTVQGDSGSLNNWIIVFDWGAGEFVTWDLVSREPAEAIKKYVDYERQFTTEQNFEVVMIGSSDVATVQKTHSHYFGIRDYNKILESLDQSIIGFAETGELDVGARKILSVLVRKKYWGTNTVSIDTLRNHFVKNILTFDSSLAALIEKDLVHKQDSQSPVSLNLKMKKEIEKYLS